MAEATQENLVIGHTVIQSYSIQLRVLPALFFLASTLSCRSTYLVPIFRIFIT